MTFLIAIAALGVAGYALLRLLRLETGRRVPDLALAWLVGAGWFAAVAPAVRFVLRVPLGRSTLAALVLAPVAGWAVVVLRARRAGPLPDPPPRSGGGGSAEAWLPRPRAVFLPIAAYVAVVTLGVLLHGANSPTQTDDAVRVRAFAPVLAFEDEWSPEARAVLSMAGPLPSFVPAAAWIATRAIDQFHVNYAVLTELVALLALLVGLGAARGRPDRGWAGALAILSLPLFLYHCTSTYSDAVLAMRVAGALAFAVEHERTRDRADLSRALLLLGLAALVKREGELVAAAPAAVLLGREAWRRWRGAAPFPWRPAALLAAPVVLGAAGKIAAVGLRAAFPMAVFVATQAGAAVAGAPPAASQREAARIFLADALFRSGNQGMIFWLLGAVALVRAREIARGPLLVPVLAVAALLVEVAVSSIVVIPQFTLDQGTVHRALLVASVPAAVWLAAAVTDAVRAEVLGAARPEVEAGNAPARRGRRRGGAAARRPERHEG